MRQAGRYMRAFRECPPAGAPRPRRRWGRVVVMVGLPLRTNDHGRRPGSGRHLKSERRVAWDNPSRALRSECGKPRRGNPGDKHRRKEKRRKRNAGTTLAAASREVSADCTWRPPRGRGGVHALLHGPPTAPMLAKVAKLVIGDGQARPNPSQIEPSPSKRLVSRHDLI